MVITKKLKSVNNYKNETAKCIKQQEKCLSISWFDSDTVTAYLLLHTREHQMEQCTPFNMREGNENYRT